MFNFDLTCRETQNEVILCYCADRYFEKKVFFSLKGVFFLEQLV